jgi:hypothetical protein
MSFSLASSGIPPLVDLRRDIEARTVALGVTGNVEFSLNSFAGQLNRDPVRLSKG